MATVPAPSSNSSTLPSLPPPCPKSPPEYPDLYGKRREAAKIQMLEREIGFLQEELKIVEGLQSASKCCKEVTDFVVANSDPLIPASRKTRRSGRFWKWLCGIPCFNFSWICCCCCNSGCSLQLELPRCCDCHCNCNLCSCGPCFTCPKRKSCSCPISNCLKSDCCKNVSCRPSCCDCKFPSCPDCSCCCKWKCCCIPKCPKVGHCCNLTRCCCNPCCLFF